jgi:hypothetical protein
MYALAGTSWGLVLGVVAAVTAVAYALGFSWLFLFGDDPWPANIGWVYLAGGIAVFLAVFALFLGVGYRRGRRLEARGAGAAEIRRGAWLITGSLALGLGLLGMLALTARADNRAGCPKDGRSPWLCISFLPEAAGAGTDCRGFCPTVCTRRSSCGIRRSWT